MADKEKTQETPEVKVPETVSAVVAQMKEIVALKDSFKQEQVTFIKNLVNKDLTDNELYMFLMLAKRAGLNPFAREIIAVVYHKNDPLKRTVNYIVTRDGKRAVAYRQGGIESIKTDPIYVRTYQVKTDRENPETKQPIYEPSTVRVNPWEGGTLWGAISTVKRNGKEYTATVAVREYNTGENVWARKPETMIKKVAESQALSMAVPELLGTYDEAEMSMTDAPAAKQIEGGSEPATEELLTTLKVMGADMERSYTKQEANDEIARLTKEKGKKKQSEKTE